MYVRKQLNYSGPMSIWKWRTRRGGKFRLEVSTFPSPRPMHPHLLVMPGSLGLFAEYQVEWNNQKYVATEFRIATRPSDVSVNDYYGEMTLVPISTRAELRLACEAYRKWLRHPLSRFKLKRSWTP